jgi:hypothetical protein
LLPFVSFKRGNDAVKFVLRRTAITLVTFANETKTPSLSAASRRASR